MNRVSRPIVKWVVRTDRVTRFCSSLRAAERLMGDHLTNTGRPVQAAAGVIYDPEGRLVVGAIRDGLGWVAMDPVMVETMLLAFHGNNRINKKGGQP